jgi:GT2 family glycosyltransferase
MNYKIELLKNENGKITPKPAVAPEKSNAEIAIVFHVFYIDVWEEVQSYLNNISIPYDLYVTVPQHMDENSLEKIFALQPQVHLFRCENRGRDVLPFLLVMDCIGIDRYKYICKLHTKKTGDSPLGHVWRKLLYFDLIGSDKTVKDTIAMFENDDSICMVTGKNTILDSRRYDYGNTKKITYLIDSAGFIFQDEYYFAGGTMFWTRASLLEPIMNLFQNGVLEFEEEKGQKDNTIAHAIERFFGIICAVQGGRIAPAPTQYSQLDDATLDSLANLVLSQQYHGEDTFIKQREHLQELHKRVDELEELADLKRRFKKEIKDRVPTTLWSILKNTKNIVKTLKNNPQILKKVWFYLKRGELRYLIQKIKDKSENNLTRNSELIPITPQNMFCKFAKSDFDLKQRVIDIIIPVYNGYEFLEKLFDSIEKHTTSPYRLIVVEDASSDERVLPYIKERLKAHKDAILIQHSTNKGFVRSVNEAYAKTKEHFVLLNTDTEVPAFWLERLMYPIVHMDNVASTTPFTNAGTIASFPKFIEDNAIFEGLDVEALDRVFRNVNPSEFYEEIPTGVGFCMGVNKTLADTIGFFDEESFGKGYGEENDWCQRAIKSGYKNLLVPNLFVYHKHGGSFSSEEKQKLIASNLQILAKKHPNYDLDVQKYVAKDPHKVLRQVLVVLATSKTSKKIDLIIDHALGGGANHYAQEYLQKLRNNLQPYVYLTYDYYSGIYTFSFAYKEYNFGFKIENIDGIKTLLEQMEYAEIFVNSLVSFQETDAFLVLIKDLKDIYKPKLIVPFHDYYPICPSFTLLNQKGQYCNIPDLDTCQNCLEQTTMEWKNLYNFDVSISHWRKQWGELLELSDTILCFSQSSQEIVLKAYPQLEKQKIKVIPHKVTPIAKPQCLEKTSATITIGILGAINYAKGASIVKELVDLIEQKNLDMKVVVIGEITEYIQSKHFSVTGKYKREELPQLICEYEIDCFVIPSICPETFSYTTDEVMQMEYPLFVFPLGAPAQRVKEYEKGEVVLEISAQALLESIQEKFK